MFAKVYVFTQFLPLHICWAYMSNIWRMVVETAKKLCFRPWKSRIFKKNLMFDFWLHFCSSQCNESNWAVLSRFFQNVRQSVCFHSIFTPSYLLSLYEPYLEDGCWNGQKIVFQTLKVKNFQKKFNVWFLAAFLLQSM